MEPYILSPRPAVDYSFKRPVIYLLTRTNIEVYRLGYVKLYVKIPIIELPTTMVAEYGLLSVSSGYNLVLYQNNAKICQMSTDIFAICQIVRSYQSASAELETKHDILLFDDRFRCLRIFAEIHNFNGAFFLGKDDFDYELVDLLPGIYSSFNQIQYLHLEEERYIMYAGSQIFVFDAKICYISGKYRILGDLVEPKNDVDDYNYVVEDYIIYIAKSSQHSNVIVAITSDKAMFIKIKENASRAKLLYLNYDFYDIRDALLTKETFYAFFDDRCAIFSLKSRLLINQIKLHNRHVGNRLISAVPITTTGEIRDEELAFIAVSYYHLQFYVNNILKMERLIPGDVDNIFFRERTVTKQFDYNLRFLTINKKSKRLIITTQDYKQADTNLSLEKPNFTFTDVRYLQIWHDSAFGIISMADDDFGFRFDLFTGEYTLFNAPGGRTQMCNILAKIREEVGARRDLNFYQKNDLISDNLARNKYYTKYAVGLQDPDVIRSYSVNRGMFAMVYRKAVSCYYSQSGTMIFENLLGFEPICCYINTIQNETTVVANHFNAGEMFETFLLCFSESRFVLFDAARGKYVLEAALEHEVAGLLENAEHVYILDSLILLNSYDRLAIIRPNVSSKSISFTILRNEPLIDCRVARNYMVSNDKKLYFSSGSQLMFFDILSAAVFELFDFGKYIRHFDVQNDVFAITFANVQGVFFFKPSTGNLGRRIGGTIVQDVIVENEQTKGEKMLYYLSANKSSIRKVISRRKKHFSGTEAKDFLKEEDVLFLSEQETVELLNVADSYERLGIILLLCVFRSEMLQSEAVYYIVRSYADDLIGLVRLYESSYETSRAIVEEFM